MIKFELYDYLESQGIDSNSFTEDEILLIRLVLEWARIQVKEIILREKK